MPSEQVPFILMFCVIAIVLCVVFLVYILSQMRTTKQAYSISNKDVEKMTEREIRLALQSEELNTTRWVEDILQLLFDKSVLTLDELPHTVQVRLKHKRELRERLNSLKGEKNGHP